MKVFKSLEDIDTSIISVCLLWSRLRSKDPNTKVGAAVYHPRSGALFLGYNGFPKGFPDYQEVWNNRDSTSENNKYDVVVHAEANAIMKALKAMNSNELAESTLYITHYPCKHCVKDFIIPSGIKTVKYLTHYPYDMKSEQLLRTANISLYKLDQQLTELEICLNSWQSRLSQQPLPLATRMCQLLKAVRTNQNRFLRRVTLQFRGLWKKSLEFPRKLLKK
jgi:dCMP deaminase